MRIEKTENGYKVETRHHNGSSFLYGENRLELILSAIEAKFEYEI